MGIYKIRTEFINKKLLQSPTDEDKRLLSVGFIPDSIVDEYNQYMSEHENESRVDDDIQKISNSNFFALNDENIFGVTKAGSGFLNPTIVTGTIKGVLNGLNFFLSKPKDIYENEEPVDIISALKEIASKTTHDEFIKVVTSGLLKNYGIDLSNPAIKEEFVNLLGLSINPNRTTENKEKLSKFYYKEGKVARKDRKEEKIESDKVFKKMKTESDVHNITQLAYEATEEMNKKINESQSTTIEMAQDKNEVTPEIGFGSAELAIITKHGLLDDDSNQKKTITVEESILKYNKGISTEEIQAWVWYKRQFGNPMKGWEKYFLDGTNKQMINTVVKTKFDTTTKDNAFRDLLLVPAGVVLGKKTKFKNEYRETNYVVVRTETNELIWVDASAVEEIRIKTEAPQEEMDRLINAGALIFDGIDYFPVPVFLFGDIYKRIRGLKENKEIIVNKFSEEVFNRQLALTDSYKPKMRSFREQIKSNRPHVLSLSEFGTSTDKFGVIELNDEVAVKIGRHVRNRFETNTSKISLFEAFQFWFRETVKDTDLKGTTKVNIEKYYWAKSIRWEKDSDGKEKYTQAQKDELVGNARITCEDLFSDFLATALTYEDAVELDVIWNEMFNAFTNINQFVDKIPVAYAGSTMFKDGSLGIRAAQRHGLAFLQLVGSGCVAYDVGFGKTLTGILNIAQLMAQGKTVRPLVVVPKPTYTNWLRELFGYWSDGERSDFAQFPNSKYYYGVLSGSNIKLNDWYNLSGAHYKKLLEANNGELNKLIPENTITVVSYKGFEQMGFSREINDELLSSITLVLQQKETFKDEKEEVNFLENVKGWLGLGNKNAVIMVDKVGFDHITVDEAHNFKNVFANCGKDAKTGRKLFDISASQSTRAVKMFFITQYLQRKFGKNVVLLTATPFTNSPLEMYSMLSFIGLDTLNHYNLYNIKKFFENFILETVEYAINVKGEIITKPVIKSFQNLKLLQTILYNHFDYKDNPKEAGVTRPCLVPLPNNDINTYIDMNEWQIRNQQSVVELAKSHSRNNSGAILQAINKSLDNAFSPYLFANETPETATDFVEQSPKVKYTVECIRTIKQWHEDRNEDVSGSIIYTNRGKQYFDYIKEYLIDNVGFKRGVLYDDELLDEVEIIVGAGTEAEEDRKELIKDAFNAGIVKVIIGTATIREGLNLQARSPNTFDLYPEWNPTQIHQLKGRNWRQGNRFGYVRFTIPLVINSMDNFVYQKQDEKSKRISSLWNAIGDSNVDELTSDLDPSEVKYELIDSASEKFKLKHETIEHEASRMLDIAKQAQKTIQDIDYYIDKLKKSTESIYGELKGDAPSWYEYSNIMKTKVLPLAKKMNEKFAERVNLSIVRTDKLIKDLLDFESSGQADVDKILKICRDLRVRKIFLDTDESEAQRTIKAMIVDYRWNFNPPYERRVDDLKGDYAQIKYSERTVLTPYGKSWSDNLTKVKKEINGRVNEADAYLESLKDEVYKAGLMAEIEAELSAKKALRGNIDDQVTKFASLNYLMSYLSDNTDRENCPIPLDICCPTNGLDIVYRDNTTLKEPVIVSEFIERKSKFNVGDYVSYKTGDIDIEKWIGVVKRVVDLDNEFAYRLDAYTIDVSDRPMMNSEKTNETYEAVLRPSTKSEFERAKKQFEDSNKTTESEPTAQEIQEVIDGYEIILDTVEGEEKEQLTDAIEGLKILLESMEMQPVMKTGGEFGINYNIVFEKPESDMAWKETMNANSEEEAKNKFKEKYPNYKILNSSEQYENGGGLFSNFNEGDKVKHLESGKTLTLTAIGSDDAYGEDSEGNRFHIYIEDIIKEEKPVKLSNERSVEIANETKNIIGNKALYMLGAYDIYANNGALIFKIKGSRKWKGISVRQNSLDLFDVTFKYWRKKDLSDYREEKHTNIPDTYLHKLIEDETGLYTKLFEVGGEVDSSTTWLTISEENPLSNQLAKLTGDSWNAIDFESTEGEQLTTETPFRHIKSGRIFGITPKTELAN